MEPLPPPGKGGRAKRGRMRVMADLRELRRRNEDRQRRLGEPALPRTSNARLADRRGASTLAPPTRSPSERPQVSPPGSGRTVHCRLPLHCIETCRRSRRFAARGKRSRRCPRHVSEEPRLDGASLLELRCVANPRKLLDTIVVHAEGSARGKPSSGPTGHLLPAGKGSAQPLPPRGEGG